MNEGKAYNPRQIEQRWLKCWDKEKINSLVNPDIQKKYYVLEMFPYPSGEPHMGHARNYTIGDVIARVMSRKGYSVLHPMGYDAFGLPAENAAIKSGIHPKDSTMANIEKMRDAFKRMAMTYDFDDEIITSEPDYYRWTQWLFLVLFRMGLAEKKEAPVNWCDSCQTVLANEQVINGQCERCDSNVRSRILSQWFFKITDYAQRLLDDMEMLKDGWPEKVLTIQQNWIGRSEGAIVDFALDSSENDIKIPVFTTRPDTLFGATFFILAAEHPLIDKIVMDEKYRVEVEKIRKLISQQGVIERDSEEAEKIGCFTGRYVINPLNGEKIPVWMANYVLMEYGTGAIMAVPAHDTRDFDFAMKYGIAIREVISPDGRAHGSLEEAYTGEGIMINSGQFNGMDSKEGKKKVTEHLEKNSAGKFEINYKLKDWLISRQRYWGAPIPVIYCDRCGTVAVPEDQLPVLLPYDVDFRPTGLSPLSYSEQFVNTDCPECGGPAKRETDTMDTFVCSSWYFLRYCSPHFETAAFDEKNLKYWMPVDQYIGGIEHATMHLIYSRFFIKALYDRGLVDFREPFTRYYPHGVVTLGGKRMSKSKGNLVNPSEIYNRYGSDVLRLYILFIGPADSVVDWTAEGVEGASRFLKRFWRIVTSALDFLKTDDLEKIREKDIDKYLRSEFDSGGLDASEKRLLRKLHQTIKKVSSDVLERFSFNTAISAIMELVNMFNDYGEKIDAKNKNTVLVYEIICKMLILLSPVAPFITEELWEKAGNTGSIHNTPWPSHDPEIAVEENVTVVFQVNGRLRDKMDLPAGTPGSELEEKARDSEKVRKFTRGKNIRKIITVPDRLVNIVVDS